MEAVDEEAEEMAEVVVGFDVDAVETDEVDAAEVAEAVTPET